MSRQYAVPKDIYRKILQLARDTGKSVGDLTNDAYKALLSTADGAVEVSRTFVQSARESKVQIISMKMYIRSLESPVQ